MTDLESAVQAFLDVLEEPPGVSWWWSGTVAFNIETPVDSWPPKRAAILKAAREMTVAAIDSCGHVHNWADEQGNSQYAQCGTCYAKKRIDRLLAQRGGDAL